jgi:hypothetical protein
LSPEDVLLDALDDDIDGDDVAAVGVVVVVDVLTSISVEDPFVQGPILDSSISAVNFFSDKVSSSNFGQTST